MDKCKGCKPPTDIVFPDELDQQILALLRPGEERRIFVDEEVVTLIDRMGDKVSWPADRCSLFVGTASDSDEAFLRALAAELPGVEVGIEEIEPRGDVTTPGISVFVVEGEGEGMEHVFVSFPQSACYGANAGQGKHGRRSSGKKPRRRKKKPNKNNKQRR